MYFMLDSLFFKSGLVMDCNDFWIVSLKIMLFTSNFKKRLATYLYIRYFKKRKQKKTQPTDTSDLCQHK